MLNSAAIPTQAPKYRKIILSDDKDVNALFTRYQSEVSDLIYEQLGSWDDAADLTQETFLHYARVTQWLPVDNPRDFLFTIATTLVTEFSRCSSIAVKVIEKCCSGNGELDAVTTTEAGREDFADTQEWQDLSMILEKLPPRCLEIFFLRRIEGLSYAEISAKLNIPPSIIESDISLALEIIRNSSAR